MHLMARQFIFVILMLAMTATASAQGAPGQGGDPDFAAADRRIDKLEEQIVDLQSQIATLESLANSTPQPSAGDFGSGGGGLDAQMRDLAAQVAGMAQRLQQMERQLGFTPAPSPRPTAQTQQPSREAFSRDPGLAPPARQTQGAPTFGSTTVEPTEPGRGDYSSEPPRRFAGAPGPQSSPLQPLDQRQAQPVRATSPDAKALYDQAYGSLVKREYSAAETYFTQFLKNYPNDALAGPAQFWLGETAFVAGEYRQAADMFLKSYTNYPASEKAPESLLKLGVSLKRLGENSAACDTFVEIEQRFPQAQAIVQRAQAEKRRSNC